MHMATRAETYRIGTFELSVSSEELRKEGRLLKLQPQPFKLLVLLVRRAGSIVTREEIRQELWPEGTYVDFDQAVNFAIKQVRTVLGDDAERPVYVQTVPRRGYRFIAPVDTGKPGPTLDYGTSVHLQKALWQNVAELRLAEVRRRRYTILVLSTLAALVVLTLVIVLVASR